MDIETIKEFVECGQRAQAAINQITEAHQPKTGERKVEEIKQELKAFEAGEQGAVATLDAINSIVN